MHFDVFNGDADGLCALHQLRLAHPREAVLVTGVKRDIALLQRVDAKGGDTVTVLDVSLAVNAAPLARLLEAGVTVEYFDHHFPGDIPVHPRLVTHIDTDPHVCTGIIVDRILAGRHRAWAVAAAFGDGLLLAAGRLADALGMDEAARASVRGVGEALAYNAYGEREDDLIARPAELYARLRPFADPVAFARADDIVARINRVRGEDLGKARDGGRHVAAGPHVAVLLPDEAWSRRVRAAIGNELAQHFPDRAHAVLVPEGPQSYTVSVRAPVARPRGAAALCARFPGGGGREAAAGINDLPRAALEAFLHAFAQAFPK